MAAAMEGADVQFIVDSDDEVAESSFMFTDQRPFDCDRLDEFLNDLTSVGLVKADKSCAGSAVEELSSTTALPPSAPTTTQSGTKKVVRRDLDGPRTLKCLNEQIKLASSSRYFKSLKFVGLASDKVASAALSTLRFPDQLASCFSSRLDTTTPKPDTTTTESSVQCQKPKKCVKWWWRGRNRMTLLDREPDSVDCDGKQLDAPTQGELRQMYDQFFPSREIPFLVGCASAEKSSTVDCRVECASRYCTFSLFMELRSRQGSPWRGLVLENVVNICPEDSSVVDVAAAAIAATAVRHKNQPFSRLFVPVSADLTLRMNCLQGVFPNIDSTNQIYDAKDMTEVRSIVHDLVKFVERQFDFKELIVDPEASPEIEDSSESIVDGETRKFHSTKREKNRVIRELKRLANVSVSDERSEDDVQGCRRSSCVLGCLCGSLRERPVRLRHCARIDCMFECECGSEPGCGLADWGGLAKIEKTWHQTVIRKNNDDLELQSYDRTKRETKIPSRYVGRNFFEDRARMCRQRVELNEQSEKPIRRKRRGQKRLLGMQAHSSPQTSSKRLQMTRADVTAQHLTACRTNSAATMADVNIWCSVHNKFDCFCANWIIFSKYNKLVYKPWPSNQSSLVTNLTKAPLGVCDPPPGDVQLYNLTQHCARTALAPIDYTVRNSSPEYEPMLTATLETGFLAYSNGFVKAKPAFRSFGDDDDLSVNLPIVPSACEPNIASVGELVRLSTSDTTAPIDVGTKSVIDYESWRADPPLVDPVLLAVADELPVGDESEDQIVSDSDSHSSSIQFIENEPDEPTVISDDDDKLSPFAEDADSTVVSQANTVYNILSEQPKVAPLPSTAAKRPASSNELDRSTKTVAVRGFTQLRETVGHCSKYSRVTTTTTTPDEDDYPKFGLLCMSCPELGYVVVKNSTPGNLVVETSAHPDGISFENIEKASVFMKRAVKIVDADLAHADWVMVTRGVLEKYKSKKFLFGSSAQNVNVNKESRIPLQLRPCASPNGPWGPRIVKKKFFLPNHIVQKTRSPESVEPMLPESASKLSPDSQERIRQRLEVGQRFSGDLSDLSSRSRGVRLVRISPQQSPSSAISKGGVRAVLVSKSPGFIKVPPTVSRIVDGRWSLTPPTHDTPVIVDAFGNPLQPPAKPPRADVIVPRRNGFASLLSPAPSDDPHSRRVLSVAEAHHVVNSETIVLQDSVTNLGIKGYICVKKQLHPAASAPSAVSCTTPLPYRSIIPKH